MFLYSIFWKIFSYIMFSFCNSIIKYLLGGSVFLVEVPLPIYIIIMYSYIFGVVLILPYFYLTKTFFMFKTKYFFLHFFRLIFFVSGFLLWGLSFKFMTLVQVAIISFGSYLLSIIVSVFFLKELITLKKFIALIVSILGVFITTCNMKIVNQDNVHFLVFFLPIFASFSFSLEKVISRKLLLLKEQSSLLTFYSLFFTAPFCLLPIFQYGWVNPEINHFFYFFILGILSILSIYSHNKSYVYSEVTLLMPFFPFKLIISCIFGFFFFGEIPNFFDIFIWFFILVFCSFVLFYSEKK
ncbi:MAG TPA: DMT family transporter [Candidatus Azosocius sp. HAIN]